MQLSERKNQILCMAVEEYIKDCSPITSGSVKEKTNLGLSTATLRNELNALEAMGFLKQLHTSGGRIPTVQGYRYYVENLISSATATNSQLEEVKNLITSRTNSLTDIISGIAKIVSHATNYPTVVMLNGIENLVLDEFKIIPLLEQKVMVLIGTKSGYISQDLNIKVSIKECQDASLYLTKNFKGETVGFMIENIDQFEEGMKSEITAFQNVVDTLIGGLKKLNNTKLIDVHREGSAKLLQDDDIDGAKKVLNVLDDKDKLASLVQVEGKKEIEVDLADEEKNDCSVVKAPICLNGNQLASIGVIGPQRMDYASIASALKVVIDSLKDLKGE